jgi:hypothetical protein
LARRRLEGKGARIRSGVARPRLNTVHSASHSGERANPRRVAILALNPGLLSRAQSTQPAARQSIAPAPSTESDRTLTVYLLTFEWDDASWERLGRDAIWIGIAREVTTSPTTGERSTSNQPRLSGASSRVKGLNRSVENVKNVTHFAQVDQSSRSG